MYVIQYKGADLFPRKFFLRATAEHYRSQKIKEVMELRIRRDNSPLATMALKQLMGSRIVQIPKKQLKVFNK